MALQKSKSEHKADVLLKVIQRGRASARQASVLLGVSKETAVNWCVEGRIQAVRLDSGRYYVTLAELVRCGLTLPPLPQHYRDRVKYLLENDIHED